MIADFQRSQMTNYSTDYVGIVFQNNFNDISLKNFKYKVIISEPLSTDLYGPGDNEVNYRVKNDLIARNRLITQVQWCLDEAYIKMVKPNSRFKVNMAIQQMPYPPYIKSNPDNAILLSFVATLSAFVFLIISSIEISFPANEKFIGINVSIVQDDCDIYLVCKINL